MVTVAYSAEASGATATLTDADAEAKQILTTGAITGITLTDASAEVKQTAQRSAPWRRQVRSTRRL
jgi:hypothetical protein